MRFCLVLGLCLVAGQTAAQSIVSADYTQPTDRYPHAILGDGIEHAGLRITLSDDSQQEIYYKPGMVFEDTTPRFVDLDGDGNPEVIVVETSDTLGARLAVWGLRDGQLKQLATTPHIGRRFRWLAVAGAADMNGDGSTEIAYVDRPHLAKTLMVWRYNAEAEALEKLAEMGGVTNHRIGEADIGGGMRVCGDTVEVITASADWSRVIATRLENGQLIARDVGPHSGRASLRAALACE